MIIKNNLKERTTQRNNPFVFLVPFVVLLFFVSCAPRMGSLNVLKSKSSPGDTGKAAKDSKKKKKDKVVWVQKPLEEQSVVSSTKKKAADYLMNFESILVKDFIETMMSGVFKRNFMITQGVQNMGHRFSIKMTEDLPEGRAFQLFTQVLAMYNVSVSQRQNTYFFDVAQKNVPLTFRGPIIYGRRLPESVPVKAGEELTLLVPFYNIEAKALKAVMAQMLPSQTVVLPVDPLNLMVISGPYDDIKYTLDFIRLLDRAQFKEKSILMITPEYWDIVEFRDKVEELLAAEGMQPDMMAASRGLVFIPIEKLNSLIVISPEKELIERVLYWLEQLDVPGAVGEAKKVYVYKLKNVEVDSIYEVLQSYAYGTEPNLSRMGGSRLGGKITGGTGKKTSKDTKSTRSKTSLSSRSSRLGSSRTGAAGDMEGQDVSIIPILDTNTIVIVSTPVEYKKYLDILKRVDVPRQQVFVEVIIGEVTLDHSTQLGLEFWMNRYLYNSQFGTKGGLGVYKGQDEAGHSITPLGSNFLANGVLNGTQFEILLNALVENSKIKIISTPKVMVVENEEAEISVGSDVPVISSESAVTSGTTGYYPFRSVQYINTGIILKVKAAVLTDNKISLEIEQEISEALENSSSDISSPEILKRKVKSTLIVTEGQIAFLGGLFQERISKGGSGIPVLSKLPLLGALFRRTTKQTKKTELVVFINSKTIQRNNDMREIVEGVQKLFSDSVHIDMEDPEEKTETTEEPQTVVEEKEEKEVDKKEEKNEKKLEDKVIDLKEKND